MEANRNTRYFLISLHVIMPKNLPEKEQSGTFENSKLFPDNQLQKEHSRLLMFPDHQSRDLLHFRKPSWLILLSNSTFESILDDPSLTLPG